MPLITTTSALSEACARLARHPFVTVDTEFMRESTYFPKLCLIQLASPEDVYLVDPSADGIDLTTARPDPIIDADGRIDLSRANAYGRLLAALSGMEAGEGHSTDQMLQTLLASIDLQTGTLSPDGLMDLVSGARLVASTRYPAAAASGARTCAV